MAVTTAKASFTNEPGLLLLNMRSAFLELTGSIIAAVPEKVSPILPADEWLLAHPFPKRGKGDLFFSLLLFSIGLAQLELSR
jgi:hypothetical protein